SSGIAPVDDRSVAIAQANDNIPHAEVRAKRASNSIVYHGSSLDATLRTPLTSCAAPGIGSEPAPAPSWRAGRSRTTGGRHGCARGGDDPRRGLGLRRPRVPADPLRR